MRTTKLVRAVSLPLMVVAALIVVWTAVWMSGAFHASAFPAPLDVVRGFGEEFRSGRLITDLVTSLFRVTLGFLLAVVTGIPTGLWMGQKAWARTAFLPIVNFFRNLSPLAWIPFAILSFGVGRCVRDIPDLPFSVLPLGARDDGRRGEHSGSLRACGTRFWHAAIPSRLVV